MLDVYLVIVPIFGLLPVLNLISLKFTLSEPKTKELQKYQPNPINNNQQNNQAQKAKDISPSGYSKTFSYLIKNYTIAQFCYTRRPRNKIILLLSISVIALFTLFIKIPYVFSFVGTAIIIAYTLSKILSNQNTNNQPSDSNLVVVKEIKQDKFQQKSQIFMTSVSILANLIFLWSVYKNYHNLLLTSAMQNFIITAALDNFIVRPVLFAIFTFTIKNNPSFNQYVDKQSQIAEILSQVRVKKVHDAHISALSPKKLINSPSKVPKALEIEPRVGNKQNYISTLDLTKSLKKPSLSPISLKKRSEGEAQCSLISILNSNQKKRQRNRNPSFDLDKSLYDQKVQQEEGVPQHQLQSSQKQKEEQQNSKFNFETRKKNKLYSSKLIMINQDQSIIHNLENDIQNQEDEDANYNKSTLKQKSLKDSDLRSASKNVDGLKISLHNSIQDNHPENHFFQFQQNDANYQQRPHSTLEQDNSILGPHTNINSSRKTGLLKINQDRSGQDLQEIDLNSPQRRKQQLSKIVQDCNDQKSKIKKKKGYKKYSLDPNRHVIKHSTGQPYLQFLPNLLNKQRDQKKRKNSQQSSQQVFSRKIDLINGYTNDSRLIKSVKRQKNTKDPIVRQNDENRIPQFIIQDFN